MPEFYAMTASTEKLRLYAMTLVQSMLGLVSPNFRQVKIEYFEDKIQITFILETVNEDDIEAINDITDEFSGYIWPENPITKSCILHTKSDLSAPPLSEPALLVYWRRE